MSLSQSAKHFDSHVFTHLQILHRAKRGFGFVLRGAKAASPLMQLKPSPRCPALQYLDDVDPGGVADMAGLLPGDFLLAVSQFSLSTQGSVAKAHMSCLSNSD